MRRCLLLLLVIILIPSAHLASRASAQQQEVTLIYEGFESRELGSLPPGWTTLSPGAGGSLGVSDRRAFVGDRSLMLASRGGVPGVAVATVSSDASRLGYEVAFSAPSQPAGPAPASVVGFCRPMGAGEARFYAAVRITSGGELLTERGDEIGRWQPGSWYSLRVILDRVKNEYSVWVNGRQVASGVRTEWMDTLSIGALCMSSAWVDPVYYDEVRVFVPPEAGPISEEEVREGRVRLVAETLESYATGMSQLYSSIAGYLTGGGGQDLSTTRAIDRILADNLEAESSDPRWAAARRDLLGALSPESLRDDSGDLDTLSGLPEPGEGWWDTLRLVGSSNPERQGSLYEHYLEPVVRLSENLSSLYAREAEVWSRVASAGRLTSGDAQELTEIQLKKRECLEDLSDHLSRLQDLLAELESWSPRPLTYRFEVREGAELNLTLLVPEAADRFALEIEQEPKIPWWNLDRPRYVVTYPKASGGKVSYEDWKVRMFLRPSYRREVPVPPWSEPWALRGREVNVTIGCESIGGDFLFWKGPTRAELTVRVYFLSEDSKVRPPAELPEFLEGLAGAAGGIVERDLSRCWGEVALIEGLSG